MKSFFPVLFTSLASLTLLVPACGDDPAPRKFGGTGANGGSSSGGSAGSTSGGSAGSASGGTAGSASGGSAGSTSGGSAGSASGGSAGSASGGSAGSASGGSAGSASGGSGGSTSGGSGGSTSGGSGGSTSGGSGGSTSGGSGGSTSGGSGGSSSGCTSPLTMCGSGCVNLNTDAMNCGSCNKSCKGGTCSNSKCQPQDIATGQGRLFMVQLDGSKVYWGGDGLPIRSRVKNLSAAPTNVIATNQRTYSWGIHSNFIYWANDFQDATVQSCALPSCSGGIIAQSSGPGFYRTMANDPARTNLVWMRTNGQIQRKALPGGTPTTRATAATASISLALDSTNIYYADKSGANWSIKRVPIGSGSATTIAANVSTTGVGHMTATPNGSHLYFHQNTNLVRIALPGGGAPQVVVGTPEVHRITSDANNVYWTDRTNGAIVMCARSGCSAPTLLANGQGKPWGIAVDANHVYWATEEGNVRRVALP